MVFFAPRGRVMDERGVLWALADQPPLDDGKVIEPLELPALADLRYPDSLSVRYELGSDGIVYASRSWGTGVMTFEEGPNCSGTGQDSWALEHGRWVPGHAVGAGPPTVVLGAGATAREATAAERVTLDALGLDEVCGWEVTEGEPPAGR